MIEPIELGVFRKPERFGCVIRYVGCFQWVFLGRRMIVAVAGDGLACDFPVAAAADGGEREIDLGHPRERERERD